MKRDTTLTELYTRVGGLIDQAARAAVSGDVSDLTARCRFALMQTPKRDQARLLAVLAWTVAVSLPGADLDELARSLISDPLLGGWNMPANEEAS